MGGLAGGCLKIIANWNNPIFPLLSLCLWAGAGLVIGVFTSLIMEKWFNGTHHD